MVPSGSHTKAMTGISSLSTMGLECARFGCYQGACREGTTKVTVRMADNNDFLIAISKGYPDFALVGIFFVEF